MNKRDIVLFAVIVVVSAVLYIPFLHGEKGSYACIYVNGELYGKYDMTLAQDIDITNNGITDNIVISEGCIYMKDASCPGRQCVHSGRISRNNESICCAPAGVLIVVVNDEDGEFDAITR